MKANWNGPLSEAASRVRRWDREFCQNVASDLNCTHEPKCAARAMACDERHTGDEVRNAADTIDRLDKLVKWAIESGRVSPAKAAEVMGVSVSDITADTGV